MKGGNGGLREFQVFLVSSQYGDQVCAAMSQHLVAAALIVLR